MSTETMLNFAFAVLLAIGGGIIRALWNELVKLRRRSHRQAQFIQRHEWALTEALKELGLPAMAPIVEEE